VKASETFSKIFKEVDPMIFTALHSIADCPAIPSAFPFPSRINGTRLDRILASGTMRVSFQFNSSAADASLTPSYPKALLTMSRQIAQELGSHYQTSMKAQFLDFPSSDLSVSAVIDGTADVTDNFYRQWTLNVPGQVQRSVLTTPACTMWASAVSMSFFTSRKNWRTIEDLAGAASDVVIPLYSTVHPFKSDIRNILPNSKLIERPMQNFESDRSQMQLIFSEFQAGNTTVLLASKADIVAVIGLYQLDLPGFNTSDISTLETRIVLPVGALLPLAEGRPPASPTASTNTSIPARICSQGSPRSAAAWLLVFTASVGVLHTTFLLPVEKNG
jgi:hypothetical protein